MPRDEHNVVAGVSRAGGAIWRTAHSRAHRFVPVSLSFFLSFSPSFPSLPLAPLSFPYSFSLGLSLSLYFSLSSTFSFVRLVHSYYASAASSATSGPGDEEGPSGPIYPRASCDDPVDGFQKYTETGLN